MIVPDSSAMASKEIIREEPRGQHVSKQEHLPLDVNLIDSSCWPRVLKDHYGRGDHMWIVESISRQVDIYLP